MIVFKHILQKYSPWRSLVEQTNSHTPDSRHCLNCFCVKLIRILKQTTMVSQSLNFFRGISLLFQSNLLFWTAYVGTFVYVFSYVYASFSIWTGFSNTTSLLLHMTAAASFPCTQNSVQRQNKCDLEAV